MKPQLVPYQRALSFEFPSSPYPVETVRLNNVNRFSISEANPLAGPSSQRLANFFCKGIEGKHFWLCGSCDHSYPTAAGAQTSCRRYKNKCKRLCASRTSLPDTEILISHIIFTYQNNLVLLTFFNHSKIENHS